MDTKTIYEKIKKIGIVPVVVIDDVNEALHLAKALIDGGIKCAEVTFRTDAAADAIKRMAEACPELNPHIVQYVLNKGIVMIPGCVRRRILKED